MLTNKARRSSSPSTPKLEPEPKTLVMEPQGLLPGSEGEDPGFIFFLSEPNLATIFVS
jgi:hypothetical protein